MASYSGGPWIRILAMATVAIFCVASAASAGQKKKKAKDADATPPALAGPHAQEDQINQDIGEMLAAFQLGDVNTMHKYYADNATFVSDLNEPPLVGWQNYAAAYDRQRAAFHGVQVIRRNTLVFTHGDVAWASYQWEFLADADGRPYSMLGHTTLVFEKVGENWLIVHNHTSQVSPQQTGAPQNRLTSTPANPAQVPPPSVPR